MFDYIDLILKPYVSNHDLISIFMISWLSIVTIVLFFVMSYIVMLVGFGIIAGIMKFRGNNE
jgi:hypothetical protein